MRRTLWSLAHNGPSVPFEVVVVDDGSEPDILPEVQAFSSRFPFTFVRLDTPAFERVTSCRKFWNNCSLSQNLAARHARGHVFCQLGNDMIVPEGTLDRLLAEVPPQDLFIVFPTTLDMPQDALPHLDPYGANLTPHLVRYCAQWPLASPHYHADGFLWGSLCSRSLYEALGGYDERYVGGLGKEDSDFMRRARALPGWEDSKNLVRSRVVTLHQNHGSRTRFSGPLPSVITEERWKEGEALSKQVWDLWDGTYHNRQPWPWGEFGVTEVICNGY